MSKSAWVLESIDALRKAKQDGPGRTHVHKLLYLGEALMKLETPFEFELYKFGPYSFDLDASIRDLCVAELVTKNYKVPNYGPNHGTMDNWEQHVESDLSQEQKSSLSQLAKLVADKNVQELELIATCCWAEKNLDASTDDEIVTLVQSIKPRYDEAKIRVQLDEYKTLREKLQPKS